MPTSIFTEIKMTQVFETLFENDVGLKKIFFLHLYLKILKDVVGKKEIAHD